MTWPAMAASTNTATKHLVSEIMRLPLYTER
jgi:hypothetical protein